MIRKCDAITKNEKDPVSDRRHSDLILAESDIDTILTSQLSPGGQNRHGTSNHSLSHEHGSERVNERAYE